MRNLRLEKSSNTGNAIEEKWEYGKRNNKTSNRGNENNGGIEGSTEGGEYTEGEKKVRILGSISMLSE